MLKNYLTIAWRNIRRQRLYTMLNVLGLTVGIAASLFILLYLDFELHFDRFHEHKDRLYRVNTTAIKTHERELNVNWQGVPRNFGALAKENFPEIESYVRFYQFFQEEEVHFDFEGRISKEEAVYVADSNALQVFSFDLIAGDDQSALQGPNKVIISQTLAQRIFGEEKALGKQLKTTLVHSIPDTRPDFALEISGVFKDLPANSHLRPHALISAETDPHFGTYYFNQFNSYTYLLLYPEAAPSILTPKLTTLYEQYLDPEREPVLVSARHSLLPITEIHLTNTGGHTYIYIFSGIGLLLLLISMISYVNLVTAQASRRALEVGIRKVLGSLRGQLMAQFLIESLLITSLALVMALIFVLLGVKPFNQLMGLQLDISQLKKAFVVFGIISILLTMGVLGGSYPAFFLSSFKPLAVMKGKLLQGAPLRRGLVVVQFAVVLFVLTCTGMIYRQLQFMRSKDLGFDQAKVVQLQLSGAEWMQKQAVLRDQLLQHAAISSVGSSSFIPGRGEMGRRPVSAEGTTGLEPQFVRFGQIDHGYLKALGIELVAGRNFSPDFQNDLNESVLINEAFARNFGLENPIGARIRFGDQNNPNFETIVGVVKDFHQNSLHNPIESQLFTFGSARKMAIKIKGDLPAALHHIEQSWEAISPNTPFEFQFLNEDVAEAYAADRIRASLFLAFSVLTLFIAFLGLFGLASYVSAQRGKEMAIRKIIGAKTLDLVSLLTKDFLILVGIAALPAFLAAWWMIRDWLAQFAYQTDINYLIFGLTLLFTLLLALITTSFHALRAASLNPADVLRSE